MLFRVFVFSPSYPCQVISKIENVEGLKYSCPIERMESDSFWAERLEVETLNLGVFGILEVKILGLR